MLSVRIIGKIDSKMSLSLINATGKILINKDQSSKSNISTIPMAHLPAGMYFLRIADSKGIIKTFEIVKL